MGDRNVARVWIPLFEREEVGSEFEGPVSDAGPVLLAASELPDEEAGVFPLQGLEGVGGDVAELGLVAVFFLRVGKTPEQPVSAEFAHHHITNFNLQLLRVAGEGEIEGKWGILIMGVSSLQKTEGESM